MIRAALISALIFLTTGLPAHAWLGTWQTPSADYCVGKFSEESCLRKESTWIVSGDSAVEVRIREVSGQSKRALQKAFAAQGADWAEFDTQTRVYGGSEKVNKEKYRVANYRLRGLYSADGKTELLPPAYKAIYPFSDQIAMVKTIDDKWKMTTMGRAPALRDVPFDWSGFNTRYGNSQSKPRVLIFSGRESGNTIPQNLMAPDGSIALTIDNGRIPETRKGPSGSETELAYFAFDDGLIGFPIVTESGVEASVFVDAKSGLIDRIDDPLVFMKVHNGLDYKDRCGLSGKRRDFPNADHFWTAMIKVGELPADTGFEDRNIYMPLDGSGRPVRQDTDRPFVGMAAIIKDGNPLFPKVNDWAFVYADKGRFTYKVISSGGRRLVPDGRYAQLPENLVYLAPKLDFAGAIWDGRADADIMDSVVGERTLFAPGRFTAIRLLQGTGAHTSLSPWLVIEDCTMDSTRDIYVRDGAQASDATGEAAPLGLVSAEAGKRYLEKQARIPNFAKMEREAAALAERKMQAYVATARQQMAQGENVRGDGIFYLAARREGGSLLNYYWRDNKSLPYMEDASEICGRFGGSSPECNLVWPWAQAYYDKERAARDAEAERMAAEQAAERERFKRSIAKPTYVPTGPPEIRYCWRENGFWNC